MAAAQNMQREFVRTEKRLCRLLPAQLFLLSRRPIIGEGGVRDKTID